MVFEACRAEYLGLERAGLHMLVCLPERAQSRAYLFLAMYDFLFNTRQLLLKLVDRLLVVELGRLTLHLRHTSVDALLSQRVVIHHY